MAKRPPVGCDWGATYLHILLCYPFLDLRFLIQSAPRPRWVDGAFGTVGSFGKVIHGEGDGLEAQIRASAGLAFGREYEDYLRYQERLAKAEAAGPDAPRPKFRQRKGKDPVLANGFAVCGRSLLANSEGHVRLELILSGEAASPSALDEELDSILTSAVHVVREGSTELISAGFPVARLYLEQSAKTADPQSEAVTVQLLREGAGSPFLIVLHPDSGEDSRTGTPLPVKPDMFAAVTCRLAELAGQTTGVWEIWGAGGMSDWLVPVRMLCRIICQLSEVASLTTLQQDPNALAPHLLDPMLTDRFYRTKAGQLRRPKQGVWSVQAVQPFAAQHLNVALDEKLHSKENLTGFLRRDVATDVGKSMDRILTDMTDHKMLKQSDRMRLVNLLARQALNEPNYFSRLMKQANLTQEFRLQKQTKWSGDIETDAMDLVDWALAKGTNPAERERMTLASLLLPELPKLGLEDAATIVATVSRYGLVKDGAELSDLQIRYQVPILLPTGEPAQPVGPDIAWQGPDDLELQSWLAPAPPDYLDVGYLIDAISNASSVCLVQVGASGETGTGVLVHDRYVLTNYHVVQHVMTANGPAPEASTIQLTFGSFSEDSKCHEVALDPAQPVAAWSPVGALDYALLRLSSDIDKAVNAKPAKIGSNPPPLKAALSILQHPHGGSMKLAPSHNAVTFIDPATGLLQYVTRTSSGSSGAPCFDDKWELVAIHHAERSRTFGSIREGILIGPIRKEIEKFLM